MKNIKNSIFRVVLIVLVLNCVYAANWKLQALQVFDIIQNNYVESTINEQTLTYGAIKGMLESLNDPYSRFLEPQKYTEMKVNLSGNFFGIGIHIGMKKNRLTVIAPILDTPADKAGMRAMDTIAFINKQTTEKMSLEEAVTKIRGPEGTKVTIGIIREGVPDVIEYNITREKIDIKSVDSIQVVTGNVGYFRLLSFESREATKEIIDAIKLVKKKGAKSLIVDLRNNGGGLLSNAQTISSLFLDSGTVVYTVDRNGNRMGIPVIPNKKLFDGPLVILINGGSASASEILAGAIRDNKRGKIVGSHSFGKASVQNIIPLTDGSAILLTIAKYYTPNGSNIHGVGILPDNEFNVPSADIEAILSGNFVYSIDNDFQLQQALKIAKGM